MPIINEHCSQTKNESVYVILPLSSQNKYYYYKDSGIRDDVIRKLEQEAMRDSESVQTFELAGVG